MQQPAAKPEYLVFDIETVVDGQLVADTVYRGERVGPAAAIVRLQEEQREKTGNDFIPHTFHIPVVIAVAKVDSDFSLIDVVAIDAPQYRALDGVRIFWEGWKAYRCPTLVTFNGRGFDLPVLELACLRYGISVPDWFALGARSYEQPRNRFNTDRHLDLQDLLTNNGAAPFRGGLDLAARLIGVPGKLDTAGDQVQTLYESDRLGDIADYCVCDVLSTYLVFLRAMVAVGKLDREDESKIRAQASDQLVALSSNNSGVSKFLSYWSV